MIGENHDFYKQPIDEFCNIYLQLINKICKFFQWSIDEIHNFFHIQLTKFLIFYFGWLTKFGTPEFPEILASMISAGRLMKLAIFLYLIDEISDFLFCFLQLTDEIFSFFLRPIGEIHDSFLRNRFVKFASLEFPKILSSMVSLGCKLTHCGPQVVHL